MHLYPLRGKSRISSRYFTVLSKYIINGKLAFYCQTLNKCTFGIGLGGTQTPKKGYKSITVKTEVYDYFFNQWIQVKDDYAIKKGIRSFSAYITYRLSELITEDKKRSKKESA
jgi:hypothetical protein